MKVLVKIYDGVKYFRGSEKVTDHTYTDVESWKVVGGREAEEVEKRVYRKRLRRVSRISDFEFCRRNNSNVQKQPYRPFQSILITS